MAIKFTNVVVQGLLIASLALPSASLAQEQGSEELAPGFDACMGQATATVEMVNCLNSAYEYWDGILNRNYRQAIRDCADSGEPECKKKLQKAQRDNVQNFSHIFLGSPGQVLLCLKSGHHGRLSRTHGPDVYFCFW